VTAKTEQLFETEDISIVRVHGPARDPVDGTHRRIVMYVRAGVSERQLATLLHDVAGRIERTLPRVAS